MNSVKREWAILFMSMVLANNLVPFVTSQYHCENGKYTSNSTYRANLDSLISSFPSAVPESGFYNASTGAAPDVVSLVFLCRGDLQLDSCRSCARNLAVDIMKNCPEDKQAFLYGEYCLLRFSDKPIFQRLATSPGWYAWAWENATSLMQFKAEVQVLLSELRVAAAAGGAVRKVAAGNRTGPDSQMIYGLVQCTPDIAELECNSCLAGAARELPACCDWRRLGAIFRPSCTLRFDTSPFYNQSMFQKPSPPLTPEKGGSRNRIIVVVAIPIAGCVTLAAAGICIFLRMRRMNRQPNELEISSAESLQYEFDTIRDATGDFAESNKLGEGGFGIVYKGKLVEGKEIAVKRLSRSSEQADLDFKNEVLIVARLEHRNLVKLLGFCINNKERILVYEFVQNASLDYFLFGVPNKGSSLDSVRRPELDWNMRLKIIKGIAKGLVYLHEDSRLKIIHRDLKASNVLLDEDMNPKIADFGLARLFVHDETHESTSRIAGTFGYMAPEYVSQGHFSVKSDVFGFGVLAMEIMSGQKNGSFRDERDNVEHLISYAWRNWEAGRAENVLDSAIHGGCSSDEMLRCVHIALLCVQENPVERPTMAAVVHLLGSSSPIMAAPSKPGFFLQGRLDGGVEVSSMAATSADQLNVSRNFVSITDMYPR